MNKSIDMHVVRVQLVDAFTDTPFHGNPAGVVIDADTLSEDEMQLIAREMNASETAFVMNSEEDLTDMRVRWFTPTQEVPLCGHATIAAFHALAGEGRYQLEVGEEQSFLVETRSGNLTVDVDWHERYPFIKFSLPLNTFEEFQGETEELVNSIGLPVEALQENTSILQTDTGYLYLLLKTTNWLHKATSDQQSILNLHDRYGVTAIIPGTANTDSHDWELRCFAPALGVNEDPVTGSANGPMALYLLQQEMIQSDQDTMLLKGKQGGTMDRQGTVHVIVRRRNNKVDQLKIAGLAVTVLDGNITLPS